MRALRQSVLWMGALQAVTGCATIFGGGTSQELPVTSAPTGVPFRVVLQSGQEVAAGTTPQTVMLPRRQDYLVVFAPIGGERRTVAVTRGANGWTYWNLLNGGIGYFIDASNGAAFKLEPSSVMVYAKDSLARH